MERRTVRTRDGVGLSYLAGGAGRPMILMAGWSQAATLFAGQFAAFSAAGQVIALDNRGHGESDKPGDGYRVQRFAKDLYDVIEALELKDFDIVSHSLSVSVTWSYLDMFGAERPARRLVLIDEPAALLARPGWDADEIAAAGAVIPSLEVLEAVKAKVRATRTVEDHLGIVGGMFTPAVSKAALAALARENLKLPRNHAADLIGDNVVQDWRSLIARVPQPALVCAGAASIHPLRSQEWIAETLPNGRLEVFPAEEGGSHFLMFENPERFNRLALAFLLG